MIVRKIFDFTRIAFWIGLVLVIYIFAVLAHESSQNYQLRLKADVLDADITKLQSDIESLGYKVAYYKTDLYQEKLAREKLNLQRPGEQVVIVRDPDRATPTPDDSTPPPPESAVKTNFQQWVDFLFGGKS